MGSEDIAPRILNIDIALAKVEELPVFIGEAIGL
jgi:hypothetical protein